MQTSLTLAHLDTELGQQADSILRNCVHCGFCNATCPTYQLTGDELDGPRGRIYQIKQVLEGDAATDNTLLHLDRCLTCRNCETTCPSGVQYSRLLDTGRHLVEQQVERSFIQRISRSTLRHFLLSPFFGISLKLGRLLKPVLPGKLKRAIPSRNPLTKVKSPAQHDTKVLLVQGCVQKTLQPSIDAAAIDVFNRIGIETIDVTASTCCGALSHHLSAEQTALEQIKHNIDIWLPLLEDDHTKAITMTASGCGVMIRDYQHLLQHDTAYAEKAKRISEAYLDPIEIAQQLASTPLNSKSDKRIAFHPPCTLQHGQKITGQVEALLESLGYTLLPFDESHLCCGSAGTYSITQRSLSQQLRQRKLDHIESTRPDIIVTANIGCQTHLQSSTEIPVRHWLELLVS